MIPKAKNPKPAPKKTPHRIRSVISGKKKGKLPVIGKKPTGKALLEGAQDLLNSKRKDTPEWAKMICDIVQKSPLYKNIEPAQVAVALHFAIPSAERGTLTNLAQEWGVSEHTINKYRMDATVMKLRFELMVRLMKDNTNDVLDAVYKAATRPDDFGKYNDRAQKLWLQVVEEWTEKIKADMGEGITLIFGGGKSKFMKEPEEVDEDEEESTSAETAQVAKPKNSPKK